MSDEMTDTTDTEVSTAAAEPAISTERAARKVREGTVVSNAMDKTAVVAVVDRVRHAKYNKFVLRTKKLYAHDETNDARTGDTRRADLLFVAGHSDRQLRRLIYREAEAIQAALRTGVQGDRLPGAGDGVVGAQDLALQARVRTLPGPSPHLADAHQELQGGGDQA